MFYSFNFKVINNEVYLYPQLIFLFNFKNRCFTKNQLFRPSLEGLSSRTWTCSIGGATRSSMVCTHGHSIYTYWRHFGARRGKRAAEEDTIYHNSP